MTEAPRWSLNSAHYLPISILPDGTKVEWEHRETARESGGTVRKLFPVPMYLDPKDVADHNYPGEIIVSKEVDGAHCLASDYIFTGNPTPEMEPLNESAQSLSDTLRHKWDNPIESLPANGGMTGAEEAFMARMVEAFSKVAVQTPVAASVPKEDYDELKERLLKLEAMMANGKSVATAAERRV